MASDITLIVQNLLRAKEDHDRQVDQLAAKLQKSCRLCLCEEASQISLFSNLTENVLYLDIANKLTDVVIERDDKLPTRICVECSNKLTMFHKLKLKCEKSRSYLESIYNLLYKVSPSDQTRHDEMPRQAEQKNMIHEQFEIVEVLEEDDEDGEEVVEEEEEPEAMEGMPNIVEEFGFDQENNSYNVHLSEEGDLSFTPLPVEAALDNDDKSPRRGAMAASTSMRRDTLATSHQSQTKIEEHISYGGDAAEKKDKVANKSYSQKILLQTRCKQEQPSSHADTDRLAKRKKVVAPPTDDDPVPGNNTSPEEVPVQQEVGVEYKFKNTCELCGASYKLKLDFKRHILEAHGIHAKIECTLCGKVFARESHLRLHHRIHTNNRPFQCDVCEKRFIKGSDLIRHKKIHSDDKDYSCGVCQKTFKRRGDVKSHMRTHTGERPYKCVLCEKPFSSHSSMKKHTSKMHTQAVE